MKTRNLIIASIIATAVAGATVMTVNADAPRSEKETCDRTQRKDCDKDRKGWGGHKRQGFDILNHSEELGLSEKQVDKIKEIKSAFAKETIRLQADIDIIELDLKELHRDSGSSMKEIAKKVRESEAKQGDLRIAKYQMMKDVGAELTPEQREKLREIMKSKWSKKGDAPK